ncbi:MAG: L-fucose:H+ symporter permease [Cytophagales bacterium]|nr:L-fucose:H+ symporter permease [Cytophagales bacterium]
MKKIPVVSSQVVVPFVLITICFALWGFANDITNPMVKAFSKIFLMSNFQGSLVQFAFYGGYFAMAIPAAIFIKKYSYKSGILVGLALYALGGLLFIPASMVGEFTPFLFAYFILTCGLSFLETGANPYILSMGDEETSTQRLNLAQAFNPIGSLTGMLVAGQFILARLDPQDYEARQILSPEQFEAVKMADLAVIRAPYVGIGVVIAVLFIIIFLVKMPKNQDANTKLDVGGTFKRLLSSLKYREGVVAQAFYVGAQIMCWTFIIHYGTEVFTARGMTEKAAEGLSLNYNIAAMVIFVTSRFICTFLLRFIRPGVLLMNFAIAGIMLLMGVIFVGGLPGIYCLVGVSACMSLMFPTIYGIALKGLGDDAKLGAAGLIMAILGGSLMPPLQGYLIDVWTVPASFVLPVICFIVIATYGYRVYKFHYARVT